MADQGRARSIVHASRGRCGFVRSGSSPPRQWRRSRSAPRRSNPRSRTMPRPAPQRRSVPRNAHWPRSSAEWHSAARRTSARTRARPSATPSCGARTQRLRALKRAAACTVDVAPPRLTSATANEATLTLTFDDTLAGAAPPPAAFTVTVDGLRWRVESATLAGRSVALRLGLGVNAGEAVAVSYEMPATNPLRDAAGRYSVAFRTNASNTTPAGPTPPAEPGYSPVIPKPSFADSRVIPDPWVGEWGPKTDPYWLPSTGALRGLIIPVDFADAPSTRTVEFYRDYLGPTSESYFRENSYGRLAFTLAAFPRWLRMPGTMASWAGQLVPAVGAQGVPRGGDGARRRGGRLLDRRRGLRRCPRISSRPALPQPRPRLARRRGRSRRTRAAVGSRRRRRDRPAGTEREPRGASHRHARDGPLLRPRRSVRPGEARNTGPVRVVREMGSDGRQPRQRPPVRVEQVAAPLARPDAAARPHDRREHRGGADAARTKRRAQSGRRARLAVGSCT